MSSGPSIGLRLKSFFRATPWTAWLIAINIATWLLMFFRMPQVPSALVGELGVRTAWKWLTYPLFSPEEFLWFAINLFVFYLFAGQLERRWGSEKFGRVFVVLTLLCAGAMWCGYAVLQNSLNPTVAMAGIRGPDLCLFLIWAALNDDAPVLAYFVIPVKARYLAAAFLVLSFFDAGHPILGAALISVPIASWFWARRPGSGAPLGRTKPRKTVGQRIEEVKRAKRKSKFTVLEGKSKQDGTLSEAQIPDLRALNREVDERKKSQESLELDRILDKIRFEGMSSLTPEEKETLDSQSRRLNDA